MWKTFQVCKFISAKWNSTYLFQPTILTLEQQGRLNHTLHWQNDTLPCIGVVEYTYQYLSSFGIAHSKKH